MATDLGSFTFNARVGMPLLIQPVRILDKISDRDGRVQYLVRLVVDGEFYNQVQLIDPSDLIKVEQEGEA